jgi:hypothetical protein
MENPYIKQKQKEYKRKMNAKFRRRLAGNETVIRLRSTDIEKNNLFNEASIRNMTFSTLIRQAVNHYTKKKVFSDLRKLNCVDDSVVVNRNKNNVQLIFENE